MSSTELDNLVKIGKLKREPPVADLLEADRNLLAAVKALPDLES